MRALLTLLVFVSLSAHADYNVTIVSGASSNGAWSGASPDVWTPSGSGATVSVGEIQSRLTAGTPVTIVTSGGGSESGDVTVGTALGWSANTLTLSAARDVNINAVMTASGAAALVVNTTSGTVRVGFAMGEANGFAGRLDLPGRTGTGFLAINGQDYTVINSLGAEGSITGTDLQGMLGNLSGHYALGVDIDAITTVGWNGGAGFASVGTWDGVDPSCSACFTGTFDGLGHTVSGLTINRPTGAVGLFFYAYGAVIRDVGLLGGSMIGGGGGLVSINDRGTISNSYSTGAVTSSGGAGGLVGSNDGAVSTSYNAGTVSGYNSVGGLVGWAGTHSVISKSYSTGTVIGTAWSTWIGGLVGYNSGSINRSYSTSTVSAYNRVGGLVGENDSGTISNSYSTGAVSSGIGGRSAGLVSWNNHGGTISACYSTGTVNNAGGGGLISINLSGTVSDSYWNTETSGRSTSGGGTGLTTVQMKQLASFNGWDISDKGGESTIWRIYEGQSYPLLREFLTPATVTANNDSKIYDGSAYIGGNGVTCSTGSCSAANYLGTVAFGGNSQGAVNAGSYAITPTGLYSSQLGYDISFANGTLVIGTPSNAAPNATSLAISGTAQAGQVLTGSYVYGDAESDAQDLSGAGSSYRFVRSTDNSVATVGDNTDVASGATGGSNKTYTVQVADVGKYLFYCVKPRASTGTSPGTEACSAATAAVSLIPQAITGFAPTSPVVFGAAPATLTASGGASGNPVVFATGSAASICTVSGTQLTYVGVGVCNLTANQAAGGNYSAAPQVTASITINAAPAPIAAVTAIPTLSEWGVILLSGLLALFGLGRVRRQPQARR